MLSVLTAIIGFFSNFTPQVFKYFEQKRDNEHELKMLELQMKASANQHAYKLEEINANADIAESVELHKPQESFGVQILDSASKWSNTNWGKWVITLTMPFYVMLDFLSGSVRPIITYAICSLYIVVKYAQFNIATETFKTNEALIQIWTEQDFAILTLCLGFWFGHRVFKSAFGGSSQDSKKI